MTSKEFTTTCRNLWGYGWQTKAAIALGIARETVRNYSSGIHRNGNLATIKTCVIIKLKEIQSSSLSSDK